MTQATSPLRGLGLVLALAIGLGGCAQGDLFGADAHGKNGASGAGIDPDDLRSAVVMGRVVLGGMAADRLIDPDLRGARGEATDREARRKTDFDRVTEMQGEQLRRTVRFADGVRTARREGASAFFELGPQAVLAPLASAILADDAGAIALLPALRKDQPEVACLVTALASAYAAGNPVDWNAFFEPFRPFFDQHPSRVRRGSRCERELPDHAVALVNEVCDGEPLA